MVSRPFRPLWIFLTFFRWASPIADRCRPPRRTKYIGIESPPPRVRYISDGCSPSNKTRVLLIAQQPNRAWPTDDAICISACTKNSQWSIVHSPLREYMGNYPSSPQTCSSGVVCCCFWQPFIFVAESDYIALRNCKLRVTMSVFRFDNFLKVVKSYRLTSPKTATTAAGQYPLSKHPKRLRCMVRWYGLL